MYDMYVLNNNNNNNNNEAIELDLSLLKAWIA